MRPIVAVLAFVATAAALAPALATEVLDVCQSDRDRICVGAAPNATATVHCLSRGWSELTDSCRRAMREWNAAAVRKTGGPQHPWHPGRKPGKAARKGHDGPKRGD